MSNTNPEPVQLTQAQSQILNYSRTLERLQAENSRLATSLQAELQTVSELRRQLNKAPAIVRLARRLLQLRHVRRHWRVKRRVKILRKSGLFDGTWYKEQYPEAASSGLNPLVHYLTVGSSEGRWPHPLFDPAWYRRQNPDIAASGMEPLIHYLTSGSSAGRKPNPLFDPAWYRLTNPDIGTVEPLLHYCEFGSAEGRRPNPLFDPAWYRRHSPDTVAAGKEPFAHYLHFGWREFRSPSQLFDPGWYLNQNPDVAASGIDPLTHYVVTGSTENRWPHPLFDPAWYRLQSSQLRSKEPVGADLEPLTHYLEKGSVEGRWPNPLFDPYWYRRQNPDIEVTQTDPLHHFYQWGSAEGRRPNPLFEPSWYRSQSPDVVASGAEPLTHYLHFGWQERRSPSPLFDPAWYLAQYPDVEAAKIEPLRHYLHLGTYESRMPNPLFHPDWYRSQYPQAQSGPEPLSHYAVYGEASGLRPIPNFDPSWYRQANADVQTSGLDPFGHYLMFGRGERRPPMPNWRAYRDNRRRQALGLTCPMRPARIAVGIVTYNNQPSQLQRCIKSIQLAAASAGLEDLLTILLIDNGSPFSPAGSSHLRPLPSQGNVGFGAAHNILMDSAFNNNAEHYIAVNPDGAFHPLALEALLKMQQAAHDQAVIEALQFPEEHPKIYADDDFETPWASGACLMLPLTVFEKIGGFDSSFFMYCEDVDLSWRAKSAGFSVKTCTRALFYHPVNRNPPPPEIVERYQRSGIVLARKWGGKKFEDQLLKDLEHSGLNHADIPHPPPFSGPRGMSDFKHNFHFAPVRW